MAVNLFCARIMLPSGTCSAVTRHGVKESASIFSRLSSPEMSCRGMRSLATVTKGDSASGYSTATSSTGIRARSAHSCTWMSNSYGRSRSSATRAGRYTSGPTQGREGAQLPFQQRPGLGAKRTLAI